MSELNFVTRVTLPAAADWSQITDLEIIRVGGQDRLYATSRFDGGISSWNINGTAPANLDVATFAGGLTPGSTGTLMVVHVGGAPTLLTGGATNGGLMLSALTGAGDIGAGSNVAGTTGLIGGLLGGVTVTLNNGQQVVYGGLAGADGLGRIRLDSGGNNLGAVVASDTNATYAADVSDVAHLNVGGQNYVYTASLSEHGITTWVVGGTGGVAAGPSLGMNEGLWIAAPTQLETARVGGTDYLVVGAATSNSLSVIRVDPDGSLHVTDHMLDTLGTRFGGVTAVDVVQVQGHTYVVSGGADDGITLHQLLPGGQLVHVASIADTPAMNLTNVSAITTQAKGAELQIFVASSAERGITKLTFDTGTAGSVLTAPTGGGTLQGGAGRDVITGQGGADVLRGGAGDDIIRDGAGVDVMTGGAGADTFVLSYDEGADTITDFTVGEDRLDLSGWPMVRSAGQLTMTITDNGFRITYGDEVLTVISSDGTPIDHRFLAEGDLIGGHRIPQVILPGFAGPFTRPPNLPDRPNMDPTVPEAEAFSLPNVTIDGIRFANPTLINGAKPARFGTDRSDTIKLNTGHDKIWGKGGADKLSAGIGSDRIWGQDGNDWINGMQGDDRLSGDAGRDTLLGGFGDDYLMGGADTDRLWGNQGDDLLMGGRGADTLWGGDHNDRLDGGSGGDILYGQTGRDRLLGGDQFDRLYGGDGGDALYGGSGNDQIWGNAASDMLRGGTGDDRLWGQDQADDLKGEAGRDRLYGGGGGDALDGGGGADLIYGGDGQDQLWGQGSDDKLWGNASRDILRGSDGADRLFGGTGDDQLYGENGDDRLWGGRNDDNIFGGNGHDLLRGKHGNDTLTGNDGRDNLNGGIGDDTLLGGKSPDTLSGKSGADTLTGGDGDDLLRGGTGDDRLSGSKGDDKLKGGTGADALRGGDGDDRLSGGDGDDDLRGQVGDDVLTGGAGADTFVFDDGQDRILDFEDGLDRVSINLDLFPGTLTGSEILVIYGSYAGTTATIDFANGHVLTIENVLDYGALGGQIDVF
ncbi:hypothetical protein AB3Y40_20230 [Yoonia sp. R2331]|uniref:calcium-binding protein n=1 Tax=Yoonia sp. R2331 TaxID=3237238 RepID=UPI0034E59F51